MAKPKKGNKFNPEDVLMAIAEAVKDQIVNEIEVDNLVFTGQLKRSWDISKNPDGSVSVGSPLIWADVMDSGRLPGSMPPVDKLMPWVRAKMGAGSDKEAKQKAWAVAKSIEKNGIEPRHYVKRALMIVENRSKG